jgi:hypothetical protein
MCDQSCFPDNHSYSFTGRTQGQAGVRRQGKSASRPEGDGESEAEPAAHRSRKEGQGRVASIHES